MSSTVTVPDPALRSALATQGLKAPWENLASITEIQWNEYQAEAGLPFSPIKSLSGLEHARELRTLEMSGNAIEDLRALTTLEKLEIIEVDEGTIKDLEPLRGKRALKRLSLRDHKVRDISALATLESLESLDLDGCDVVDLSPLAGLGRLRTLSLYGNKNLSVAPGTPNHGALVELLARGCRISAPGIESAEREAAARRSSAAASAGDLETLLRALGAIEVANLYANAGLDARDGEGRSLLGRALVHRYDEKIEDRVRVVRALLDAGLSAADPGAPNDRVRPLATHIATTMQPDLELVRALLDAGADPSGTPEFCPLASSYNSPDVVELLLDRGATVGADAFVGVCRTKRTDLVRRALASGARVDQPDVSGNLPLVGAIDERAVVEILLDAGADPNQCAGRGGALFAARNPDVLELLLARGGRVDVKDNQGASVLHSLAHVYGVSSFLRLVEAGADVNARDERGWTPAHQVANQGQHEDGCDKMLTALLARGADLSALNNAGKTPLEVCSKPPVKATIKRLGGKTAAQAARQKSVAARGGEAPVKKTPKKRPRQ